MENTMAISQKKKKIKHRITIWSRNSTAVYKPKIIQNKILKKYLYTHMSIAALFTIDKTWKQFTYPINR